jgi:hypothetical protein
MEKITIDYLWVSESKIMNVTKVIKVDVRKFDGLGSYFGITPRLLKEKDVIPTYLTKNYKVVPVALYTNPLRKNSYIVIGEDKVLTRSALIHNLDNQSKNPGGFKGKVFSIKQEFNGNDNIGNKLIVFEDYLDKCLTVDLEIDTIDYTIDNPTCMLSSIDPLRLCDNFLVSQYLFKKILSFNGVSGKIRIDGEYGLDDKIVRIVGTIDPYKDIMCLHEES